MNAIPSQTRLEKISKSCPLCQGGIQWLGNFPCLKSWDTGLYYCNECGSLFRSPMPSHEQLQAYYDSVPFRISKSIVRRRLKKTNRQALSLTQLLPRIGFRNEDKILDIGAGIGGLVKSLREKGLTQVIGLEGRAIAVDFCQKEFGIELDNGWMFKAHEFHPDAKIILLSHVLEHLDDPGMVIDYLKTHYPGSILWIEVPHGSYAASALNSDVIWTLWLEQHLWSFTPKGLRDLLESHGLRIIEIEEGWNYPGYNLIRKLEFSLAHTLIESSRRLSINPVRSIVLASKLALINMPLQIYKWALNRFPLTSMPDDPFYLRIVAELTNRD